MKYKFVKILFYQLKIKKILQMLKLKMDYLKPNY